MKSFLGLISLVIPALFAQAALASNYTYPVLIEYETLAVKLEAAAKTVQTPEEIKALQADTHTLMNLGFDTMDLFASKIPVCAEQFAAFKAAAPEARHMTVEQVHAKFHNGEGLPAAPRVCYFGRSQVVHPMLNILRLNDVLTADSREQVVHDFEEVIEHLEKIQRHLDNPPN